MQTEIRQLNQIHIKYVVEHLKVIQYMIHQHAGMTSTTV
jgi:hypothetical protein